MVLVSSGGVDILIRPPARDERERERKIEVKAPPVWQQQSSPLAAAGRCMDRCDAIHAASCGDISID
jgi:hypothetical protein